MQSKSMQFQFEQVREFFAEKKKFKDSIWLPTKTRQSCPAETFKSMFLKVFKYS